jgi:hypothetical protein
VTVYPRLKRDEDGAVLLLALAFLTAVLVMVTALIFRGDSSFRTTIALNQGLQTQYAADAVVQEAMTSQAASENWKAPLPIATPPETRDCPVSQNAGTSNPVTLNGVTVWAECTYLSDAYLIRTVEITACQVANSLPDRYFHCPAPVLRAHVTISQSPTSQRVVTIDDWSVLYGSSN